MATGQTWYVTAQATGGNGSQGDPFGRIQDAIDAAGPGDVIVVGNGIYTENLIFRTSGSSDAPIVLMSENGAGSVSLLPDDQTADTLRISGADHIIVDGLEIFGPSDGTRQAVHIHGKDGGTDPASDITVINSIIHRSEGDGIKGSKAENVFLLNNTITGGTAAEAAIDFVGVTGGVISGNTISDIPGIGIMIKGGSSGIEISSNTLSDIGKMGIEVGGYSPLSHYPPGFLEAGNAFEAADITVVDNILSDIGNTAIRIIGAQGVEVSGTEVSNVGKVVTVDDSSKFHEPWFADDLTFTGNHFDGDTWLIDRSAGADIEIVEVLRDADTAVLCVFPNSAEFSFAALSEQPDSAEGDSGPTLKTSGPEITQPADEFEFLFATDTPSNIDPGADVGFMASGAAGPSIISIPTGHVIVGAETAAEALIFDWETIL